MSIDCVSMYFISRYLQTMVFKTFSLITFLSFFYQKQLGPPSFCVLFIISACWFAIPVHKYVSLKTLCCLFFVCLFVFNLFIWFSNEHFGLEKVSCFSCLVEGMSQTISFKGLFSTVLFLLNKSNSGLPETNL